MKKTIDYEKNSKQSEEMTVVIDGFLKTLVEIADKYGDDRKKFVENCLVVAHLISPLVIFLHHKEEGGKENE